RTYLRERPLGEADGLAHGGDPPRLRLVAGQAERPALGEARLARPAAGDHGRGVAILDVAPAGEVDLHDHRGRLGGRVKADDPDAIDHRAADDHAHRAAGVPGIEQLALGSCGGDVIQQRIVAVDRLRPRAHRAAGGDLEHVGGKPPVGQAQVHRRGMGVALVLQVGDLGHLRALRHLVGHGALDERLVAHARLVAFGGGHDVLVERVLALSALLDRGQRPMAVALAQRPELADAGDLAEAAGPLDVPAVPVEYIVLDPGVDLDHHVVGVGVTGAPQADVLDRRLADRLDVVVPAASVEIVQAPLPFV